MRRWWKVLNSLLLTETCRFKLEPSGEQTKILEELFSAYADMVEECLNKAIEANITSRKKLHEAIYRRLREKHPEYPSHYAYTAIAQALATFKSYRRLSRRRKNTKPPSINGSITVLLDDAHLFWFSWGNLKLATHKGHIIIPFKIHEHAKKFYGWRVKGSRLVKLNGEYYLHVSFRKEIREEEPLGLIGIDVNEKSIDLAIIKPDKVRFIKVDISEVKYIRDRYFRKRRNIQAKTSGGKRKRLLSKYSGRERRRVNAILHKASKVIAGIVSEEHVKPVMEKLKDIRERIRYGRKMNRRLHAMPFRKVQSYISYKAMERCFNPEMVNAKNTSRTCPICGELSKPNGHAFKCGKCGFQADRHLVAAWNVAMKRSMWGALSLPPKALNEPIVIEVRGKG